MNAKRKKVEDLIYSIMDKLDPSGFNTQRRKEEFSKMSDKEFHHYMELLRDNKTKIPIEAPNMKVVLKQRNLIKAAEALGGTPLGLVHWKRASSPVEAGTAGYL